MSSFNNWLDNFTNNLLKFAGKEKCEVVMKESNIYENGNISSLIEALEAHSDDNVSTKTLENCGRKCLDPAVPKMAKEFMNISGDIDSLLDELNKKQTGGGKLYRENNVIYAEYDRCYCPILLKNNDKVSPVYCSCSVGWFKELFEVALCRTVEVKLVQSVIQGGPSCKFEIYI